jgi:hypothetical protein
MILPVLSFAAPNIVNPRRTPDSLNSKPETRDALSREHGEMNAGEPLIDNPSTKKVNRSVALDFSSQWYTSWHPRG